MGWRGAFENMRGFFIAALVLCMIGVLAILLELQSPSVVQWDGIKVHGITTAGLTYYRYDGVNYSIDNLHAAAGDRSRRPTTVWLSRSDPTDSNSAYIENSIARWMDFSVVTVWFFVAIAVVAAGLLRRRLRLRRKIVTMGQHGSGLSDDVVRRLLEQRRTEKRRRIVIDDD